MQGTQSQSPRDSGDKINVGRGAGPYNDVLESAVSSDYPDPQHELLQSAEPVPVTLASKTTVTVTTQAVATPATSLDEAEDLLVISPYTEREHLLDLRSLDTENAILAQALVHLKCLRPDYATAPYIDTFNWEEVMEQVKMLAQQKEHSWKGSSFFVVAFRSQIPPTTVYEDLGTLDKAAHAEATASGGFLKYWFGSPDKDGKNLATCVWRSQEDARKGGIGPAHRRAAAADPGPLFPIGRLTGIGLSSATKWKAGRSPTGRNKLVG
ncbi:hypothetical protein NUW58_g1511 [Xylaria curta]|uniref:Uncharacterized protein n=2 Tax=Xylaria curta TaxID=42375 RepID=A0ACC1PKE4_9PEZI|nr:hypothetical protein NUW58_g5826 [Xylaria curta]KAJ2994614.1 hypothetical protein NUW58_g1511 [Xylaria curta]